MLIKVLRGIVEGCSNTLNTIVGRNGSDKAVRQVHREKVKYEKRLNRALEKRDNTRGRIH